MFVSEETRFDIQSKKFNNEISQYSVGDERAWAALGLRQHEIMDSMVSNAQKAQAFDRVLWETGRIFPRANNAYCQILQKRLALTAKKNTDELYHIAKDAYMHQRNVDLDLYGGIIYNVYTSIKNKNSFPYKSIAKAYRKRQLKEQYKQERENREKYLAELGFYTDSDMTPPLKKLDYIDKMIELIEEPYFGKSFANSEKAKCCDKAAGICRRELADEETAQYYLGKKKNYERLADNARNYWKERRGLLTNAEREQYMQTYRTDKTR